MGLTALIMAAVALQAPDQAGDCQAALGPLYEGSDEAELPNQIDGATIAGRDGLLALRRERGEALITVRGGDFSGADFRGARLHNVCFLDTNFAGSDWRGARASGVGFIRANLERATLADADLSRVLLRNANLKDVRAERAIVAGGRLDGGWFEGSVENLRLDGADLSRFRFDCGITLDDGCPVYFGGPGMSLRGTDLTGANLWGNPDIAGARVDRTEIGPGELHALRVADLAGSIMVRGGNATVELSPDDYRELLPFLRDPAEPAPHSAAAPRGPPSYAAPGNSFLFVDGPLVFEPAFQAHPLFRRLLAVLVGASWSRVAIRFNADGTIDAAGEAFGANGHMCSLAGRSLAFDPTTGWYSGPQEPAEDDPPHWHHRPMAVLMLSGESALAHARHGTSGVAGEEDPRFSDYASCGTRAGFSEMVRVPVSEEEALRLLDLLGDTGL